jgi:hypothetical protein
VVAASKAFGIEPNGELDRLLDQADEAPLLLVRNGRRYWIRREADDPSAGFDPERTRRALRRSAGALAGVDIDRLKADLRKQREQDSPGRPAW